MRYRVVFTKYGYYGIQWSGLSTLFAWEYMPMYCDLSGEADWFSSPEEALAHKNYILKKIAWYNSKDKVIKVV